MGVSNFSVPQPAANGTHRKGAANVIENAVGARIALSHGAGHGGDAVWKDVALRATLRCPGCAFCEPFIRNSTNKYK